MRKAAQVVRFGFVRALALLHVTHGHPRRGQEPPLDQQKFGRAAGCREAWRAVQPWARGVRLISPIRILRRPAPAKDKYLIPFYRKLIPTIQEKGVIRVLFTAPTMIPGDWMDPLRGRHRAQDGGLVLKEDPGIFLTDVEVNDAGQGFDLISTLSGVARS